MKLRIYFLLFLCLFFFQPNTLPQDKITRLCKILTLEGTDLFKAFNDYRYSDWDEDLHKKNQSQNINSPVDTLSLYWSALDKALNSKPKDFKESYDASLFIEEIIYDILLKDGPTSYPKLINSYKSLQDSSLYKDETILIPLCNYYIFSELNRLIENNTPPSTTLIKSDVKNFEIPLSDYKQDFMDDALLYKSLENHYKQRIYRDTTTNWYYVQKNYSTFLKLLEEILFTDSPDHMKNLLKFEWGGWCGTGSEGFYEQREIGQIILLLREKDYYAILGNSKLTNHFNQTSLRELIQISGLNWIDLSFGMILNNYYRFLSTELIKYGGDNVVKKLIKLNEYNFSNNYSKLEYLNLCFGFCEKEKNTAELSSWGFYYDNPFWKNWENHFSILTEKVSQKQKDILEEIIIKSVEGSDNLDVCQFGIRSLGQFKFNDRIKSVLLAYTKSKFSQVKEGAVRILKKNGVTVNLPKDNGLLAFKLLIDNEPLKNFGVYWEVFGDSSTYRHTTSSNSKTSEGGILNIPRDLILSVNKNIQRIRFSSGMFGNESKNLLFFYDTMMPTNYFDTTIINIPTSKVILNLERNRDPTFYKDKKANIYLGTYISHYNLNFSSEVKDIIPLFQKIQRGQKYYLSIEVPGSKRWSDFIEIQHDTQFVNIKLEHGTSVIIKAIAPGDNQADDDIMFEIVKKVSSENDYFFEIYEDSFKGYRSLPIGDYTIKILSSSEKKAKIISEYRNTNEILPDYKPYKGKEIKFSITKESPEVIDLGIIKLEPIE